MNAEEARRATGGLAWDTDERIFASGYLAALKGKEVGALIEALETINYHSACSGKCGLGAPCTSCVSKEALSQWKEVTRGL